MKMVGQEAIGPASNTRRLAALRQDIAVKAVVVIGEEYPPASVAALRHMMRQTGNDEAGQAGHAVMLSPPTRRVN